jgi:hypothetical protein
MAHLQRRAGTHGSITEASRNTQLIYRGDQEDVAHLQGKADTEEKDTTWLSCLEDQEEQEHVAQLQRRAGTHGSATKEYRTTWLSYKRE